MKIASKPLGTRPHAGSLTDELSKLAVGDVWWVDTTPDRYAVIQRQITSHERFPDSMRDHRYSSAVYTAVPARSIQMAIRYILRIERLA